MNNINYYDKIKYDKNNDIYTLKIKLNNLQTIYMEFSLINLNRYEPFVECKWYNVCLSIHGKRFTMYDNMDKKISTGKDPIYNFIITRNMFNAMETFVIDNTIKQKKDLVICIHWEDNRRRDAYYKVLSRKGYKYAKMPWGTKVIMKKFKWKDYYEDE